MKTRILVTGANGQLGTCLKQISPLEGDLDFHYFSSSELNIVNFIKLEEAIKKIKYDFILNFAAYTDVEGAESNNGLAYDVNGLGVKNLAKIGEKENIPIIHISTDFVFDGGKNIAYCEDDPTNPISQYGISKLAGENYLKESLCRYIIIRTSWLYSPFSKNFFRTMIELSRKNKKISVVDDQVGSPTYAIDLAEVLVIIIKKLSSDQKSSHFQELFHFSNSGEITWHHFAEKIFEYSDNFVHLNKVSSKQLGLIASRPKYSALNSGKIKSIFNLDLRYWEDSLIRCIKVNDKLAEKNI